MKKLIQSIKNYIIKKLETFDDKYNYYYVIVENTKYHELIDEFSNDYSVFKVTQSKVIGERYDLVEDGFITMDQAENAINAYMNRDLKYSKQGSKMIKEYRFKTSEVNV